MAGGKKPDSAPKDGGKPPKQPPAKTDDEDDEDGDFATPKKDRYDSDDEPLE